MVKFIQIAIFFIIFRYEMTFANEATTNDQSFEKVKSELELITKSNSRTNYLSQFSGGLAGFFLTHVLINDSFLGIGSEFGAITYFAYPFGGAYGAYLVSKKTNKGSNYWRYFWGTFMGFATGALFVTFSNSHHIAYWPIFSSLGSVYNGNYYSIYYPEKNQFMSQSTKSMIRFKVIDMKF